MTPPLVNYLPEHAEAAKRLPEAEQGWFWHRVGKALARKPATTAQKLLAVHIASAAPRSALK